MEYEFLVLDENDEIVAYQTTDGTIGGTEPELIGTSIEAPAIENTNSTPITGDVTVYYDGNTWTKIASYYDGEEYVWKDFNGIYILNRDYQFNLKFKDANDTESTVYKVMKKGTFLFHENGTWEKLEDKGELPEYTE